jgi:hypothetical protein
MVYRNILAPEREKASQKYSLSELFLSKSKGVDQQKQFIQKELN